MEKGKRANRRSAKAGESAGVARDSDEVRSPPNGEVRRITLEQVLRNGFGTILSRLDLLSERVANLEVVLAQRPADTMPVPATPPEPDSEHATVAETAADEPEGAPSPPPADAEAGAHRGPSEKPVPPVPAVAGPTPEQGQEQGEEGPLHELVWGRPTPPARAASTRGASQSDDQPEERPRRRVRPPRMSFNRRGTESTQE